MTTFDPNTDYTMTSEINHDSMIYATIMDVQNTLEEINQLLLAAKSTDIATPSLEETLMNSDQTASVHDNIF